MNTDSLSKAMETGTMDKEKETHLQQSQLTIGSVFFLVLLLCFLETIIKN